jgi:hypothetical protein
VGMTSQVSDIAITCRPTRHTVSALTMQAWSMPSKASNPRWTLFYLSLNSRDCACGRTR